MISFTSYLSSMEKSVMHDLLPKRKRMNLGVTFSFFSNSKHSKTTEANYQSLKQSSHLFSLCSSGWKSVAQEKGNWTYLRGVKRTPHTNKQKKT